MATTNWTEGRKPIRVYTEEQRLAKNKYNRELYQRKKEQVLTNAIHYLEEQSHDVE